MSITEKNVFKMNLYIHCVDTFLCMSDTPLMFTGSMSTDTNKMPLVHNPMH